MTEYYFGLDLSTQQLKVLITGEELKVHHTYAVEFDKDLPHYKTSKGVYSNESTGEIYASVAMWIEALDLVLSKIKADGFDFSKVKGISGSCQQHGSVFWSKQANEILGRLSPDKSLLEQVHESTFSLQTSPNWQDHSTGEEIKIFESYVGGAENLAKLTGSRAHYRFTGPQIRKLLKEHPDIYHDTYRISLVSSFLASLLVGQVAEIEEADACGMNLYDVNAKQWNDELLAICSKSHPKDGVSDEKERSKAIAELRAKLGPISSISYQPISPISSYFVHKYNFSPTCHVFPFTGDNLATILALPLNQDEILISLGTSTTVLLVTKSYIPSSNYHLFIHPTIPDAYMGMICYCNGSLAREKVRDDLNTKFGKPKDDWTLFNELLSKSEKFDDRLGIYFPLGEIVPNAKAQTIRAKYDPETDSIEIIDQWDVELDVSSIVESQALSCRARSSPMLSLQSSETTGTDLEFDGKVISAQSLNQRPNKVFYVGGGSKNPSIVRKFGQVLGSKNGNFKIDNANACAIGGAYKATWGIECLRNGYVNFHDFLTKRYNWHELEKLDIENYWSDYKDGVIALNKIEKKLVE